MDIRNKTIRPDCPEDIKTLLLQIQQLQMQKHAAIKAYKYESASSIRDKEKSLFKLLYNLIS